MTELQKTLNDALDTVGAVLSHAAEEIADELRSRGLFRQGGKYILRRGNMRGYSKGLRTDEFDYRNYLWLTVLDAADTTKRWMLALSFEDVDNNRDMEINSGNLHTQFGRFQFWRGLNIKKDCCNGPHELLSKAGRDITLKFCGEKSYDPKQAIFDGTYDTQKLVDDFIAFMEGSLS